MSYNIGDKKIFLIVSSDQEKLTWMEKTIAFHVTNATVFRATDGLTALSKLQNVPPHVLITDIELPKYSGLKLIDAALSTKGGENTAVIIAGTPPAEGHHLDELVTGRVQYYTGDHDESAFVRGLTRALNFSSLAQGAEFLLRFLAPGDVLLKEGDRADFVYFVKKGQLRAYREVSGSQVDLGKIGVGEFVGEMAYINGEPRNAHVAALTDCELIEVEIGKFDNVLFKRPSWSRALMLTLTRRVKAANEGKVERS